MKFRNVLEELIRFFNQERVEYALIGAFALKAYGIVRATQDVDFIVRTNSQQKIFRKIRHIGEIR